jgi:TonB family protein
MKRNWPLPVLALLICLSGCSPASPTSIVRRYISNAEKGDVEAMTGLYSGRAIQKTGIEKLRNGDESFSDLVKKAIARGEKLEMVDVKETIKDNVARVTFRYQDKDKVDSILLGFDLRREGRTWTIDEVGMGTQDELSEVRRTTRLNTLIASPTPPSAESNGAPVAGGELNAKATKLPQPAYPPVARSVHASGKVVVEVLVDETGKVVTAKVVSGHPLLHASATAAARGAEFKPMLVSGKPVKVAGTLVYRFASQ